MPMMPPMKVSMHGLDEELLENIGVGRADGFTQADLARALDDRYEHDIHDADAADDERNRRDCGEEQREDGRDGAEKRKNVGFGFDREVIFIGIRDAVILLEHRFDARLARM